MDHLAGKITDPNLRAVAESGDEGTRVEVIVELDLPPTAVPPGHMLGRRGNRSASYRPTRSDDEPFDPHDDEMDRLERDLRALGPQPSLIRLNAAQAFAVTLTPAQLRSAAGLALAGIIRPSRTHHL